MLKNYFLVALRTLRRNLGYTALNVIGLALGITCSLLLFLVIRHELSYDTFHSKRDHIYRLNIETHNAHGISYNTGSPFPLLPLLKDSFPELQPATHIFEEEGGTFSVPASNGTDASKKFREEGSIFFIEPAFFDLFDYAHPGVNPHQALKDSNSVLLTKSIAEKYFPGEEAIGQVIRMNNKLDLKVTGIVPDAPANTDLPYLMLISYDSFKSINIFQADSWGSIYSNHQVYFALPPGASVKQTESRINQLVAQYRKRQQNNWERFVMHPLKESHFDERYSNFAGRTSSKVTLWSMGLIGIVLVMVACINFVNLATAQALRRSKEVGMRKVLGASRPQLMAQFLSETAIITATSLLLSIVLTELLLPQLNQLLNLKISFSILQNPDIMLFLVTVLLLVTFFSGLYPAMILSGFQPIVALKSKVATVQSAGISLRRALVVLQFTICQILVICTLIVHNQMKYFRNASLGFDKEAIVVMPVPANRAQALMPLRPEIEAHPAIKSVTFALAPPSAHITFGTSFFLEGVARNPGFNVNMKVADENYLKTYNIPLLAGRMYEKSDTMREFLVNETFLKRLGIQSPQEILGRKIALNRGKSTGPIVGVVKDFHQSSLRNEIEPSVISSFSEMYFSVSAKVEQKDMKAALAHLQKVWYKAYPDEVFYYEFLDDTISKFYEEEQRQAALFKIFSGIAILIGCLGLYGLVSFMVAQRTKEVGVRKVLGASSASIVALFCKDFAKLVLIAFALAAPISYYIMNQWLQDFTYRIDMGYWVFLAAGALTLVIALTTVSVKALKAAFSNPVISLKTE